MKKCLFMAAVALSLSSTAYADPTSVLKVAGTLTNSACNPEISNGGVVDFGTKYISTLSATESNQLGYKDITLTITCFVPTKVAWSASDDKADTLIRQIITAADFGGVDAWSTQQEFGAGLTDGGVKIGAYSIAIDPNNVLADGATSDAGSASSTVAATWPSIAGAGLINPNDYYTVIDDVKAPKAVTTAEYPLRVALAIQGTDALAITDNTPIDGQATITLSYM